MKRPITLLLTTLSLLALSFGLAYAQVGGGYDLSWSTVDGGGTFSTGGDYSLGGTIGQHDAGSMSGGTYTLDGGFWGGASGGSPTPTVTGTPPTLTPTTTSTATNTATSSPTAHPWGAVVINELDADQTGNDAAEFIELYDGGSGSTPLTDLVMVFYNGNDDLSYASFDLAGYATSGAGYFTLGNAAVPGVDLVFTNNFLQNGADAVALFIGDASQFPNGTAITTTNLLDALVYDTSDSDDPGLLALLNPDQPQVDENALGNGITVSIGRCPNGEGGVRNTDTYLQRNPSPDGPNDCPPVSPTYTATATATNIPPTASSTPCQPDWNVVPSPNLGAEHNNLSAVAVVSANDVWAVGTYLLGGIPRTLIQHWNGTNWSVVPSPNNGSGHNYLNAVAAVSANDVWAVGEYIAGPQSLQTLTLHWDGTIWSVVHSPNLSGTFNLLKGVTALAVDDVWAVGYYENFSFREVPLIQHWNGSSWNIVAAPDLGVQSHYLTGVDAVSANDIWAVGYYDDGVTARTLTLQWDGSSWVHRPSPNVGSGANFLGGVAAFSPGDVWAVGRYLNASAVVQTLTMRWNSTTWNVIPSPNVGPNSNQLNGAVALSPTDVWAVGRYTNAANTQATLVEHWNGATWSVNASPNSGSSDNQLAGLAAVSANNLWAVGYYTEGSVIRTLVERYTGSCGSPTSIPTATESPSVTPTATTNQSSATATITATPSPSSTGMPSTATNTLVPTNTPTHTSTSTSTATSLPGGNAFAHLQPSSPITVAVGSHFTLDLMINSGSHEVVGQQSYLNFPHTMLQNVQLTPTTCISSSTVTGDFTTFEAQLQNQVCNGPNPCTFGGNTVPPGSIAFASGALNNPPANGNFRVARISFCANTVGTATVRWQFSPPDPLNRHSKITDEGGQEVSDRALYQNFTINVVEAQLVGHVTWQGRPAQPNPLQQLPITLTLRLQSGGPEYTYPNMTTDASGFFTPTLGTLPTGTYNWWVKGLQHLANSGSLSWTGGGITQQEMGLMRVGDANNDNVVDITDFTILRATFGRSCGDQGFDNRADFNGDCTVDVSDFSLLRSNFGSGGAPPIGPSGLPDRGKELTSEGQAYLELRPGKGAPPNGGNLKVGDTFAIEIWVNPKGHTQLVGQQSYLSFSSNTLQAVGNSSLNATVFDAILQNEVCNGPGTCIFRGIKTQPGSIAFASGALIKPPTGMAAPFKVGELEMRAMAAGEARMQWQLSPSAPPHRQSAIVDANGKRVSSEKQHTDYIIKIVADSK